MARGARAPARPRALRGHVNRAAAPKPRRRAPTDPHRSEPRAARRRPGVQVSLARETLERIAEHVPPRGLSRWLEGLAVAELDRLDAAADDAPAADADA